MVPAFGDRLLLGTPVDGVARRATGVAVEARGRPEETYDALVLAVHSDQALRLLRDPSEAEREVLGAIPYQENEAALHTDGRVMPRAKRAWASWNYHVPRTGWSDRATVTYWMNRLQRLPPGEDWFVTLNRTAEIEAPRIRARIPYHHPVFTTAARSAWRRKASIQGVRRTWFAGAYWGFGFHEDGARSGLEVARALGADFPDA
jgi:hypothetical protein